MLSIYRLVTSQGLEPANLLDLSSKLESKFWVDLCNPTSQEVDQIEAILKIDVPTREEMELLDASSKVYQESNSSFLTFSVLAQSETDQPSKAEVTLILSDRFIVSLRYVELRSFKTYLQLASKKQLAPDCPVSVCIGLIEEILERAGEILARASKAADAASTKVFARVQPKSTAWAMRRSLQEVLCDIGRSGELSSHIRESLLSLQWILTPLAEGSLALKESHEHKNSWKILRKDLAALIEHSNFLNSRSSFVLEASLGMISMEQNKTIQIFSVLAVLFLPPTLIASIYGMNFRVMPELEMPYGYLFALILMVLSATISFWYFKVKSWL